jgi:hypothetical protein
MMLTVESMVSERAAPRDRRQCALVLALALVVLGACNSAADTDVYRTCEIVADLPSGSPLTPDGIGAQLDVHYLEAFEEIADIAPPEIRPSAEETLAGFRELSNVMEIVRRTGRQRQGEIAEAGARFLAGFEEVLLWSESNCSLDQ